MTAHFEWLRGIRDSALSATAKHVAHVLGTYMGATSGECWPTRAVIAAGIGRSPETVTRALRELATAGWIEKQRRMDAANVYRRTIPLVYATHDDYDCSNDPPF